MHFLRTIACLVLLWPAANAAEGRFSQALDAASTVVRVPAETAFAERPLTVACWVRLRSLVGYNIVVANQEKASPAHWEIFTTPGDGNLAFYAPGQKPNLIPTVVPVVDDRWHHLVAVLEPGRVRLWVDAQAAADTAVTVPTPVAASGSLAFGTLSEGGIGCHGWPPSCRGSSGSTTCCSSTFAGTATPTRHRSRSAPRSSAMPPPPSTSCRAAASVRSH